MEQHRILILFAHPAYQKSWAQRQLLGAVRDVEAVTVNDLYEEYPDFSIDVVREQPLLLAHDIVVFQHAFYWYSSPAILKKGQDLVLEYGFAHGSGSGSGSDTLPPSQQALIVAGLVGVIVVVGRLLMRPIFRFIAATQLRELFTATGLLLVIGIALAMDLVRLSPALGTFLAGVVLADSEFRHELESDIEPFKGLLLGLFFISVGASIDFNLMLGQPAIIGGLVALLVWVKLLLLFGLGRFFKLPYSQDFLFAFAHVFRETIDNALAMGVEALRQLGFRSYQAHRAARIFKRHEYETMEGVFALWDRDADHVDHVREHMSELDRMMQSDQTDFDESRDHSWAAADDLLADDENTEENYKP